MVVVPDVHCPRVDAVGGSASSPAAPRPRLLPSLEACPRPLQALPCPTPPDCLRLQVWTRFLPQHFLPAVPGASRLPSLSICFPEQ